MPQNQRLDYYDLEDVLGRSRVSPDVADCHGLLAGLVCAGGLADPRIWVAEIFEAYDPKDILQGEAYKQLQLLSEITQMSLNSPDLDFELLLPDDEGALSERTQALGGWCSGFLTGLGLGGMSEQKLQSEQVKELLDDLGQIARVDFDLDNPDEEDLEAFEEVVEYVRVGVLLMFEELQPPSTVPAPPQLQ